MLGLVGGGWGTYGGLSTRRSAAGADAALCPAAGAGPASAPTPPASRRLRSRSRSRRLLGGGKPAWCQGVADRGGKAPAGAARARLGHARCMRGLCQAVTEGRPHAHRRAPALAAEAAAVASRAHVEALAPPAGAAAAAVAPGPAPSVAAAAGEQPGEAAVVPAGLARRKGPRRRCMPSGPDAGPVVLMHAQWS